MGKARSSVLHVVVGAGIIPHFRNAIESILSNTDDVVFAVYNSINTADSERFSVFVANAGFGDRVMFRTLGNEGPSKTGSLYDAYNLAIDFALQADFDYLNLVQADCQLMWWNEGLVARLDEILSAARVSDGAGVLCFGTTFPVFGKFAGSNFQESIAHDPELNSFIYAGGALADVGIFSVAAIRESDFRFLGTESEMQQRYQEDGFKMALLDVPCVAFVPWPATVRKGKVAGTVVEPLNDGSPLLQLREGGAVSGMTSSWDTEHFWMENWIRPNGWDCLFPYWPTSIDNPKWVRRRLLACRMLGVKPWARASQVFDAVPGDSLLWRGVPSMTTIILGLGSGYFRTLIGYQRRVFRSAVKRVRALRR